MEKTQFHTKIISPILFGWDFIYLKLMSFWHYFWRISQRFQHFFISWQSVYSKAINAVRNFLFLFFLWSSILRFFLLPEEDVEISYEPLLNLVYLWQWWNFGILRSLNDDGQYCFWELTDTTFGITCFLDDEGTGCPH